MIHRLGDPLLLHLDARDALGDLLGRAHLHEDGAIVSLDGSNPGHFDIAERLAFNIEHRDAVALVDGFAKELVRDGDGGPFGILLEVHERDGQPGADGDTFLTADAPFAQLLGDELRDVADVVLVDVDHTLRAHRRARVAGDFLVTVEHREDPGLLEGDDLGRRMAGLGAKDLGGAVPILRDFADVVAQLGRDLEALDLAGEHGRRCLSDLFGIACCECPQAKLLRFHIKLVDRIQADRNEHGVASKRLLGAWDGPELAVDLRDRDRFDALGTVSAEDRVGGVDRDAHAVELVLVHLVPAAFGQRLDQAHDLDAGLQRVIPGDQADVAAAHDEEPLGRSHQVPVDQRLERARAVDARQRVALERERLFARACGHEEHLGLDQHVAVAGMVGIIRVVTMLKDANLQVAEHGQGGAAEPHLDGGLLAHLLFELRCDVDAARARIDGVNGPEEAVRLEDKLAAEAVLVVDQEAADAALAELNGCGHPCRPTTDDEHGDFDLLNRGHGRRRFDLRQLGQGVDRLDLHAGADRFHAGLYRHAVGQDEALRALAVGAKDALRRTILGMMAEDADAAGEERRGYGLTCERRDLLPLPAEGHWQPRLCGENWVR